jgi:hypothetical protein
MNIPKCFKILFYRNISKTAIRTQVSLIYPNALRPFLNNFVVISKTKSVTVRPIRLAGVKGEEIKAQDSATQLIFHIHGGAFFRKFKTHRAFMTDLLLVRKCKYSCGLSTCTRTSIS